MTQLSTRSVREIQDWLVTRLADRLGLATAEIAIDEPFTSYGLSSQEAVSLCGDLEIWLDCQFPPTLIYDYPTIQAVTRYVIGETVASSVRQPAMTSEVIAIVGLGCRFPSAANPQAFWQLLRNGVDAIQEVPADRWDSGHLYSPGAAIPGRMNTRWGGFLEQVDQFDPQFFGIAPREARMMDPQQRLLLEVAWEALENACLSPADLKGSRSGVFIGICNFDYSRLHFSASENIDAYVGTGNALSIAANRLSYVLGLQGPSLAVDTACSSSLVALHLACQSLRSGECDMALTGGVNLILSPELTVAFSQAQMMSADGRCKTFDAAADGYVRGEGCGVVVLKRLSDALKAGDNILALVRGSAVNQDGASNGLTAPNGLAQQQVIRQALLNAGVEADRIGYIEAHGTGTALGDPIEIASLKAVLMASRPPCNPCGLGSVKTNIGHLEAAAGIAGLIKVVLALQHAQIPPHLNFQTLNPHIQLDDTQFFIPAESQPWPAGKQPRFAGVSSFGFGGTNTHVVLEEAPVILKSFPADERPYHLLALSAHSDAALRALAKRYSDFLADHPTVSLADLSLSNNLSRSHHDFRLAATADRPPHLRQQLAQYADGIEVPTIQIGQSLPQQPTLAFLCSGQGAQYPQMAQELYDTHPLVRSVLNECNALLADFLPVSLLEVLFAPPDSPNSSLLQKTAYTQPALFAVEYALAKLWISWGVQPDVLLGHSLGEYVAACLAGVFSLQDALKLVAERARCMDALPTGGAMAAVFASEQSVRKAIADSHSSAVVAAVNGSSNTVISGAHQAVEELLSILSTHGFTSKALVVSHAFHSPLMEPMLDEFERLAAEVEYQVPQIALVSNLSGKIWPAGAKPDAHYWREHLRECVRFADGMACLHEWGVRLFVEIGPSSVLLGMGKYCLPEEPQLRWLPSLRPGLGEWQQMLESLGCLYVQGQQVEWSAVDGLYSVQRLQLPTYPFERERFWATTSLPEAKTIVAPVHGQDEVLDLPLPQKLKHLICEVSGISIEKLDPHHRLQADLGFDSLMLTTLRARLAQSSPLLKQLPLALFFEDKSISQLIALLSEVLVDTPLISDGISTEFDTSPALEKFRQWATEFEPGRVVRIDRKLVHKDNAKNVLVARVEQVAEDLIAAEINQDLKHKFFYEHAKDHVTNMYILEAVEQLGRVIPHLYYNISKNTAYIADEIEARFNKFAETNRPLFAIARIHDKLYANGELIHMRSDAYIIQDEVVVAWVSGVIRFIQSEKYSAMRSESLQALGY
jgi:acyl transferase domain-containing protein